MTRILLDPTGERSVPHREPLPRQRPADGLDFGIHILGRECRDQTFRQSIQLDHLAAEPITDRSLQRRCERRSAAHDCLQTRVVGGTKIRCLDDTRQLYRHERPVRHSQTPNGGGEQCRTEAWHDDECAPDQQGRQHRNPTDVGEQPE